MELVKLIVTDYLHSNCPDQKFDDLLFATETEGKNILVVLKDGEITSAVDIDDLYEKIASDVNVLSNWYYSRNHLQISTTCTPL